jgi:hypothetical protein
LSGDEDQNAGDTKFDDILEKPFPFQLLYIERVIDRYYEMFYDEDEKHELNADFNEIPKYNNY